MGFALLGLVNRLDIAKRYCEVVLQWRIVRQSDDQSEVCEDQSRFESLGW